MAGWDVQLATVQDSVVGHQVCIHLLDKHKCDVLVKIPAGALLAGDVQRGEAANRPPQHIIAPPR